MVEPSLCGEVGIAEAGSPVKESIRVSVDMVSRSWPTVWVSSRKGFTWLENRINLVTWCGFRAFDRGLQVSVVSGKTHVEEVQEAKNSSWYEKTLRRRIMVKPPRDGGLSQGNLWRRIRGFRGQIISVEHLWWDKVPGRGHTRVVEGAAYISLAKPDGPSLKAQLLPLMVAFARPLGPRRAEWASPQWTEIPMETTSDAVSFQAAFSPRRDGERLSRGAGVDGAEEAPEWFGGGAGTSGGPQRPRSVAARGGRGLGLGGGGRGGGGEERKSAAPGGGRGGGPTHAPPPPPGPKTPPPGRGGGVWWRSGARRVLAEQRQAWLVSSLGP